jgi:hypothetical protein
MVYTATEEWLLMVYTEEWLLMDCWLLMVYTEEWWLHRRMVYTEQCFLLSEF